jgi:hypothetical protein
VSGEISKVGIVSMAIFCDGSQVLFAVSIVLIQVVQGCLFVFYNWRWLCDGLLLG